MLRALINGRPGDAVPVNDRGLAYGDGLFETMLAVQGKVPLWPRHYARLARGCERLGLVCPSAQVLEAEIAALCADDADLVIKLIVTAGATSRGYARSMPAESTRVCSAHARRPLSPEHYREGVAVRWCRTRLSVQPRLAGIKHLNRLEQVLARAEWDDDSIFEGLMQDAEDRVIGATAANLFAVVDGVLITPDVERCGIAGVMRGLIVDQPPLGMKVEVRDILAPMLERASEIFLSNAVRGVVPVRAIGAQILRVGKSTCELMGRCAALGFPPQEGA